MHESNEKSLSGRSGWPPARPVRSAGGILLVEDYEPNIITMTMFIEELGYECDVAKNGFDALDKFFSGQFGLVIMDLQLPDIDGLEVTRRMRLWERGRKLAPVPIIAASGKSADDKLLCRNAGMNDYLPKPFKLDELEKQVARWLRSNSAN